MRDVDARMRALVFAFPTLQRTPSALLSPWDPEAFAEFWACGSGGEKDAALFVLSVWNPATDWIEYGLARPRSEDGKPSGRFDMHTALGNWDQRHRVAFVTWCGAPWWP